MPMMRARRRRHGGSARPTARPRTRRGVRLARLPPLAWILIGLTLLATANYLVQVARKPTELVGLVVPTGPLPPAETWARYGPHFRDSSTGLIRPELLAALVQAESAGDPLARTYWRWRWSWNPFHVYAPASSAVGILQITDGTFAEARRYCIHDHAVAREGPWHDPDACWFNSLYFRTIPRHAIEMTSARLHVVISEILAARHGGRAGVADVLALAAVVHLCGRERGQAFAGRGFRTSPGERCGDHDLREYLARVRTLAGQFARLDRGC